MHLHNMNALALGQCVCVMHMSSLTYRQLVVAEYSAAIVVFEQCSKHLGAHLRLPPQGHVGSHHLIVCVQVVTGMETQMKTEGIQRQGTCIKLL